MLPGLRAARDKYRVFNDSQKAFLDNIADPATRTIYRNLLIRWIEQKERREKDERDKE